MTIVSGYYINKTPCCGTRYVTIRYDSMNFRASEYWTDGYRYNSLMSNNHGLCKCKCGNFYIKSELIYLETVTDTEVPPTNSCPKIELPNAIAQARTKQIELAARWDYWHYLNHAYRDEYRTHRDAEDKITKANWIANNPDKRTFLDKLRKVKAPTYVMTNDRPFTYPKFEPTETQRENMKALLELFLSHENGNDYKMEIAEIYRELGDFENASKVISQVDKDFGGHARTLIVDMSEKKDSAPIRYRS